MFCTKCKKNQNKRLSFTENSLIALVPATAGFVEIVNTQDGYTTYKVHIDHDQILFGVVAVDSGIQGLAFEDPADGVPESALCICRNLFPRQEGEP